MKKSIPSAVHADGTARYQSINETQNKKTYKMLKKLKELKGNSVIINTSFNTRSEPIVETPEEAICMFLSTEIDMLILENFVVTKKRKYPEFAFSPEMSPKILEKL
jgi:carbamoyltransferase